MSRVILNRPAVMFMAVMNNLAATKGNPPAPEAAAVPPSGVLTKEGGRWRDRWFTGLII